MTLDGIATDPEFVYLIRRYEKWRRIYSDAGQLSLNEPVWEDGRLHLRDGYPYEGWTSLIIEPKDNGCNVLRATTERRNEPLEGLVAFFSHIDGAGKYVIWNLGENLRIACHIDPIEWSWEAEGLDPRVSQISLERYVSKFELKAEPSRYFVFQAGGIQPENHLLPLTDAELDDLLLNGLPSSINIHKMSRERVDEFPDFTADVDLNTALGTYLRNRYEHGVAQAREGLIDAYGPAMALFVRSKIEGVLDDAERQTGLSLQEAVSELKRAHPEFSDATLTTVVRYS